MAKFIEVTPLQGKPMLVNTNIIWCVAADGENSIIYIQSSTKNSYITVAESYEEVKYKIYREQRQ